MEPYRIRAVGGARTEHSLLGLREVVTGMYAKDIAAGAIKPSEDDDLIPRTEILETVENVRSNTSQASGAPSSPCFGADAMSDKDDSTLQMRTSSKPD